MLQLIDFKESSNSHYPAKKFIFSDGFRTIESSSIERPDKNIICLSCSYGCPVGCLFCRSGETFYGMLTKEHMMTMIETIQENEKWNVDLVSFMGVGEPFLNIENVIGVINRIDCKVSIATSGVNSCHIKRVANILGDRIKLRISIHSTDDHVRQKLIPGTDNLSVIMKNIEDYHKVDLNYLLIKGENDGTDDANKLADICIKYDMPVVVNKLWDVGKGFCESNNKSEFINVVRDKGVDISTYETDGDDIGAACGQMQANIRS